MTFTSFPLILSLKKQFIPDSPKQFQVGSFDRMFIKFWVRKKNVNIFLLGMEF